jgi:hypothetical protein
MPILSSSSASTNSRKSLPEPTSSARMAAVTIVLPLL